MTKYTSFIFEPHGGYGRTIAGEKMPFGYISIRPGEPIFTLEHPGFGGAFRKEYGVGGKPHGSGARDARRLPRRRGKRDAERSIRRLRRCYCKGGGARMSRQYVAVQFRPGARQTYTYHNDGEPVVPGDKVKIAGRGDDGWRAAHVDAISFTKPLFDTKPIMGRIDPAQPDLIQDDGEPDLFGGKV